MSEQTDSPEPTVEQQIRNLWENASAHLVGCEPLANEFDRLRPVLEAALREREPSTSPAWSSAPPSVPGWYWMQFPNARPFIQEVRQYIFKRKSFVLWAHESKEQGAQWFGPLPEPPARGGEEREG